MNTDIEELLRESMERFTDDLRAPAGLTRRAARRRRWRLALRSGAGMAALAAGAIALAVVVLPVSGHDGTDGTAVPAAYVVKGVDSALSAADPEIAQMIITTRSVTPGGKTVTATAEEWSDGDQWRSVTNSPDGQPAYDDGSSAAGVYTLVSYLTRTWARESEVGRPAVKVTSPRGCGPVGAALPLLFQYGLPGVQFSASSLPTTVARGLRAAISCGALTVAGRQRVDGIDATELTSRPGSPVSETIWVDPATNLPVRVVFRSSPGSAFVLQQTADITWLPPTAPNLAKLTVPIPAGFREVPFTDAALPVLQRIAGGLGGAALPRLKNIVICLAATGPACKRGASVFGPGLVHPGYPLKSVPAPSGQPPTPG